MKTIEEIKKYASENYVPIAREKTLEFIISLIRDNNYKSFLEIGCAIGYTSISLLEEFKDLKVTTVEYEKKRYDIALENFKDFNLLNRVKLYQIDARFFHPDLYYDFIFIDAAKKRNKYFVLKFMSRLNKGGVIVVDNMNLDDLWVDSKKEKKEKYDNVNKEFKEYFYSRSDLDFKVYDDIGDGIALIRRKDD